MKIFLCASIRGRLEAFHDNELPVHERFAVGSHLQECPSCASEMEALVGLSARLKEEGQRLVQDPVSTPAIRDGIVGRLQAERNESFPVRVGVMFEDMHFVWAGLSAVAATATCAAMLFAIWFFSPPERADSLAGVMSALASPGSDRNPVALDPRMRVPRVNDITVVPAMLAASATEEDLVFALAAVVTQEGRIARSELLVSNHGDRNALILMNAVNEARFQPASLSGSPIAVNLVWLLTHTTVRAKKIHS